MDMLTKASLVLAAWALGGCAQFSPDGGFGKVQEITQSQGHAKATWIRSAEQKRIVAARVRELLSSPLSLDSAVELALINNPGLQASYFDLGMSEAEMVQAGRLPNPHFSMLRASKPHQGITEFKIEQVLGFNLLAILTQPKRFEIESLRFRQTQQMVAMSTLQRVAETQKAYVHAVAAGQLVRYNEQVMDAAHAAAELAKRMAKAGNFNKLKQAREQSFYAEAALRLAQAKQQELLAQEQLTRLLGLWGEQRNFTLPERLPDLPKRFVERPDVEKLAVSQRLDLKAARLQSESLAKSLGLKRVTGFVNGFELGPARVAEGSSPLEYKTGFEVAFNLPIFDWGDARTALAQATYEKHLNEAAQMAIDARSEVRQAYQMAFSQWEIARHQLDEMVPLQKAISEENLLRYNGMIIGVFELLADTRAQIQGVMQAIQAQRDFWIAQSDLDMALIGKPSMAKPSNNATSSASSSQGGH